MKFFGYLMFPAGLILLVLAFTMDTSVAVDYPSGNDFGFPERVNNLGLMADKQNYMIFGAILSILGAIIGVTYEKKDEKESSEKVCPKCAENVKIGAKICRYCSHSFMEEENEDEELEMHENIANTLKRINSLKKEKPIQKTENIKNYEFCPACNNSIIENEAECSDCGLVLK